VEIADIDVAAIDRPAGSKTAQRVADQRERDDDPDDAQSWRDVTPCVQRQRTTYVVQHLPQLGEKRKPAGNASSAIAAGTISDAGDDHGATPGNTWRTMCRLDAPGR
jgi:hypothetical protein